MKKFVSHTIDTDRPVTIEDKNSCSGINEFMDKLVSAGYVAENRDTALKKFTVEYSASGNIIKWKAVLSE